MPMGLLLLACAALVPNLQATPKRTLYVSLQGDDRNPGTQAAPFRTIQHGSDQCRPGDTLNIQTGVYRERVALTKSGQYFDRDIIIQAAPGARVVLDGGGETAAPPRAVFDTNGQDHLTIRDLRVRNGGFWGFGVFGSYRVRLANCATDNTPGTGIMVDKSAIVEVSDCEVSHACMGGGEESVSIKRSSQVRVRRCHIHDTMHEGIDVKEGSSHVLVSECHVHDVERQGLYADAWDVDTFDIRFDCNRIHDCMVGLVACTESGGLLRDVWFTNNLVYDCRGPGMMVAKWGSPEMTHRIRNVYYLNNTVVNCGNGGRKHDWGGGMLLENDQAENVVVMNNVLSGSPQKQLMKDHLHLAPKSFTVRNNLLDGPTDVFGSGNLVARANFVHARAKDFRLRPGSPGIDGGSPSAASGDRDLAGKPRRRGRIDVGAYER